MHPATAVQTSIAIHSLEITEEKAARVHPGQFPHRAARCRTACRPVQSQPEDAHIWFLAIRKRKPWSKNVLSPV
jgi:hypothetical protein